MALVTPVTKLSSSSEALTMPLIFGRSVFSAILMFRRWSSPCDFGSALVGFVMTRSLMWVTVSSDIRSSHLHVATNTHAAAGVPIDQIHACNRLLKPGFHL